MSKNSEETKVCKHCQSEIPKKAKVCPVCRKKQGGILKWIVIAVIVIAIIGAVAGSGGDDDKPHQVSNDSTPESDTQSQGETDSAEKDTFSVGETAEMNGVQVTMVNYEESNGSEFNSPSDGNVFVLIEFEIANNTDEEINVSSMVSFEAYADDYALNYSLNALLENEGKNQLDGTIASGKKMNGVIGYEVASDWKEMEIHFADNVWSNNKFKFLIQK